MNPDSLAAAGWQRLEVDGFSGLAGPIWMHRDESGGRTAGLIIDERHTNSHMGTLHGGALMTLADIALGWGASEAIGGTHCATISMQTHFVSVARIGEFVVCRPEVVRTSPQLVFMRGLMTVGERNVASVEGIWKVLAPR
ncbi:MAG TPA: PaaI family thioesterase [Porticoccaceae bacterium]